MKLRYYFMLFFTASFFGFMCEFLLFFLGSGDIVNRGFLYGPYLPIYGWGAIIVLMLYKRFKKPWQIFLLSGFVTCLFEYLTGEIMLLIFNQRWWDYSGMFLNFRGFICLKAAVEFGILGLVFIYLIKPLFDKVYNKYNLKWFPIIIFIIYVIDNIVTFIFRY